MPNSLDDSLDTERGSLEFPTSIDSDARGSSDVFWVTVSEITGTVKGCLEESIPSLWIKGELSSIKLHAASGHIYFSVKDERALLRGVMFRRNASRLAYRPEEGEEVLVFGRITVYERQGQYQLLAEDMVSAGMKGMAAVQLEQLKRRLTSEGLFELSRKRALPRYPAVLGIVTSSTGAALRDIVRAARRRWPAVRLVLSSAQVQGVDAPKSIVAAIDRQNRERLADLLIVGRGGGAREDLSAFNDESVVRAIAQSAIPVISAVGHETDVTLSDLAADARAATPSAAAEMAVPDHAELSLQMHGFERRIQRIMLDRMSFLNERLMRLKSSHGLRGPDHLVQEISLRIDELSTRLRSLVDKEMTDKSHDVRILRDRLNALSPRAVLERGYALCRDSLTNLPIDRAGFVTAGQLVDIRFLDGEVTCQAMENKVPTR